MSKAATHTPAPWFARRDGPVMADRRMVAEVFCPDGHYDDAESDANACLIAAAPELLAELQAAHRIIRHALAVMTFEQKAEWGRLNAGADVDGMGITRAHERAAVIVKAGGAV